MKKKVEVFKKGFTMVELSLSMVFVGILSLTIVFIIGDTVASYRRGIAISRVNTVGMEIVDDLRVAVQNSPSTAIADTCGALYLGNPTQIQACKNNNAAYFMKITKTASVTINGTTYSDVPVFGAFCSGAYSYIWNSGYFDSPDSSVSGASKAYLVYKNDAGSTKEVRDFRLLKIKDPQRAVCVTTVRPYSGGSYASTYTRPAVISEKFDITAGYGTISETPVDVITTNGNNDLVLYNFSVTNPAESTTQRNVFYSFSFILGTISGGANIRDNNRKCAAPSDYAIENYDYCAINKFNFAVESANGVK